MRPCTVSALLLAAAGCAPPATDATDVAIAGVTSSPSAPSSAGAPAPKVPAAPSAPGADPMAELALRFPEQDVLSLAPWRQALPGEDVVAVVVRRKGARDERSDVSRMRASETGAVPSLRTMPLGVQKLVHLDAIDLDGDGTTELLLFGEGMHGSVTALHLAPGIEQPLLLGAASAALDGCATLDDVAERLPLEAPLDPAKLATTSAAAFIGRLALAKPADLRAVLGKKGLELCSSVRVDGEKWSTKCRTVPSSRLTEKDLDAEVAQRLHSAFAPGAMGFDCTEAKCTAEMPGMTWLTFELEGAGATRRLAKVKVRDANIGE